MEEPLASVRFEQTVDDVVALHVRVGTRPGMIEEVRRRNLRTFAVAAAVMVPTMGLMTWATSDHPGAALVVYGVVMSVGLVWYGLRIANRARVRTRIERSMADLVRTGRVPISLGWFEVSLHPGACVAFDQFTKVERKWDAGVTVHDEPGGVYIEFGDATCVRVPRRAFAGDAERKRFVGVARGLAGSERRES